MYNVLKCADIVLLPRCTIFAQGNQHCGLKTRWGEYL